MPTNVFSSALPNLGQRHLTIWAGETWERRVLSVWVWGTVGATSPPQGRVQKPGTPRGILTKASKNNIRIEESE